MVKFPLFYTMPYFTINPLAVAPLARKIVMNLKFGIQKRTECLPPFHHRD
ncbi:hypothetical protein HMPREF0495_01497 [Levilactobacillus brevis ATCC 14869 = DSM 20054]|uniref:Uncharacterized protein n=1 Tax=Levilactobacillus brevis ATCC 14869 = DSM 20054 TaxID=649758 RepID=U2QQ81_LEVBR|nr:hypothetical protein HMPREF0495_01497 [Levilactobacillus brevis ATCC 14869 = DSM 20054]